MRQTNSPSDRDCEPDICRQRQTFPKHHGCRVVWIGLFRVQPLMLERRQALPTLLRANKRLSTAHCPKTPSANSRATRTCAGHGASFENWRASLKWQRLKPYLKFAAMKAVGRELPPAQSSQLN